MFPIQRSSQPHGLPTDRSANGLVAWEAHMKRFAAVPNTAVKIREFACRNKLDGRTVREVVMRTIELFGVELHHVRVQLSRRQTSRVHIYSGFMNIVADLR